MSQEMELSKRTEINNNTADSRSVRGIKGLLVGALLAGAVFAPVAVFFKLHFAVDDLVAGVITGAILGFILKACIPKGFPIPKDLTTFTCLGLSAVSLWLAIDGIITGEIHHLPHRKADVSSKGFGNLLLWTSDPVGFSFTAFVWILVGALCVGTPVWYYLKAIRETLGKDSFSAPTELQSIFAEWEKLSKNTQAIALFIITLSSILVFFYLLILLKS